MTRRLHLLAATLAAAALVAAAVPAEAATPVWVRLNASGKAAVVTQPAEIPTWFGKVATMQAPSGTPNATVFGIQPCQQFTWDVTTKDQGGSDYLLGGPEGTDLSSDLFQYASRSAADRAWRQLLNGVTRCRTAGTYTEEGATVRYVQRVTSLPALYGVPGVAVFAARGKTPEGSAQWTYMVFRHLGNAVLVTVMGKEFPLSVRNPVAALPVEVTATTEVLGARSTSRYRTAALQTVG